MSTPGTTTALAPVTLHPVACAVVSAALCAGVLLLLLRPASRRWPGARTAQRRGIAQQRHAAAAAGGAR